ncbi:MAG: 3-keto-disaccharide hydrolase, partial [Akkermansiaceae bacterium]
MYIATMKFTISCLAVACSVFSVQAKDKSVSLFNGKDTTGWKGVGYEVKNGAIICTPQGRNLMTEKVYTNYIFEFEFKLPPGGNNGIGIHYPGQGDPAYAGMEVQVLDNTAKKYSKLKDYQFH